MADLKLEDLTPEQLEAYKEELRKQGLGGALKSVENVTGADLQGRSVLADMVAGGDWYNPLSWGKKDPVQAGREAETKALGAFEGVGGPPDTQWTPEEYLPGARSLEFQYNPGSEVANLMQMAETGRGSPWEQAYAQDPSVAAQAGADPWSVMGQYTAMQQTGDVYNKQGDVYDQYQDVYAQGGMTALDRARWEESKNRNLGMARGQREAALQQNEMRGMSGGGADLAAALSAGEGAAARQSADSLGIEALSQQRRDQMLAGAGNMAAAQGATAGQLGGLSSDLRSQSFGESFSRGSAQDVVNQFNTTNLRDIETSRVKTIRDAQHNDENARREAQAGNADWSRTNYWAGTGNRIAASQYQNVEEPWRQYEANTNMAANKANIAIGSPALQAISAEQGRAAGMWGNVLSGATTLGGAYISKPKDKDDK